MTLLSNGTVIDIETAPSYTYRRSAAQSGWKDGHHVDIKVARSPKERRMKDIVWTAVISITLASIAVIVGIIALLAHGELTPLAEGAGLASIGFGLAGLSDKLDPHNRS